MELTDWQIKALIAAGSFLGGSLLSLAIAYVAVISKISYIQGQLENLLKIGAKLDEIVTVVINLRTTQVKQGEDLNAAHEKIREFKRVSNQ